MERTPTDALAAGRQNVPEAVARQIVSRSGTVSSHAEGLAHHRGIRGVPNSEQRGLGTEL